MAAAVILIPEMLSGPDRGSAEKTAEAGEGAIKTYTIDLSQSPGVTGSSGQEMSNRVPPPEEMPSTPAPAPAGEQRVPEPRATAESLPPPPADTPTRSAPVAAEPPRQAAAQPERTEAPRETARNETPPQPKPEPRSEPPPRQIAAQPARAEAPPQAPARTEPKPQATTQAKPEASPQPVASAPGAPTSPAPTGKGWAVQLGSYSSEATAQRLMSEWRDKGQNAFVMPVKSDGKTLYRVRIGPSKDRAGAEAVLKSVKASIPNAAVVAHP